VQNQVTDRPYQAQSRPKRFNMRNQNGDNDGDSDGMRYWTTRGQCQIATQTNDPSMKSFSFKRSPFANDMLTPTSEIAVGTSKLRLAGIVEPAPQEAKDVENLLHCVRRVNKTGHTYAVQAQCLCKNCAAGCLFKKLNECPMCRAKIDDSMRYSGEMNF
jgi:hypothetical protein